MHKLCTDKQIRRPLSGFTLPELLVVIVILGILGSLGIQAFFFLVRRARIQSVALETAGWLEQVRNAAADQVTPDSIQGGCLVRFLEPADATAGLPVARVEGPCVTPDRELLVPPGIQDDSVGVGVTGSNPFVFTPRGVWIISGGGSDGSIGNDMVVTFRLNNTLPVRCVRLSRALGSVEIGRPENSSEGACARWQTL